MAATDETLRRQRISSTLINMLLRHLNVLYGTMLDSSMQNSQQFLSPTTAEHFSKLVVRCNIKSRVVKLTH